MLLNVHVKNFALIYEADLDLKSGLNILTGETGAGKSILIDAVSAALGGRTRGDVVGSYGEEAFISLSFSIDDEEKRKALLALDINCEYDCIIISRRISKSKSQFKINDEPVTATRVREVTELLIDIHGQHEHQSLLKDTKQLELLDHYAKNEALLESVNLAYQNYVKAKSHYESFNLDEDAKKREIDFILFEINEIESANVAKGEKDELLEKFSKYNNAGKLAANISDALNDLSDGQENSADKVGRALGKINSAAQVDSGIINIAKSLSDAAEIINDAVHELKVYADELSFEPSALREIENRLDVINNLESKYGGSFDAVTSSLEKRRKQLEEFNSYEENKLLAKNALLAACDELSKESDKLSAARKKAAVLLSESIKTALTQLNFLDVDFEIAFDKLASFSENGTDAINYMISTNPGERVKPLSEVASGGELSRIMLGFKSVLADRDEIPTLIFDEIDTGISGKTAGLVAKKLSEIAKFHQVICITHLPQIAAYADEHFSIEKNAEQGRTITKVVALDEDGQINELARLLGGDVELEASFENARQLKKLAKS